MAAVVIASSAAGTISFRAVPTMITLALGMAAGFIASSAGTVRAVPTVTALALGKAGIIASSAAGTAVFRVVPDALALGKAAGFSITSLATGTTIGLRAVATERGSLAPTERGSLALGKASPRVSAP